MSILLGVLLGVASFHVADAIATKFGICIVRNPWKHFGIMVLCLLAGIALTVLVVVTFGERTSP